MSDTYSSCKDFGTFDSVRVFFAGLLRASFADVLRMWAKSYSRPDLYKALVSAQSSAKTPEEQRLAQVVLAKFRHVGAHLDTPKRHELETLDARCSSLCFSAEQNINEDCSTVLLSPEELEGCAPSFIQSLPEENGKKRCSLKAGGRSTI